MPGEVITLRRSSLLLLALAAALVAQTDPRDRKAIQEAVDGWWKASQPGREQRIAWWCDARFGCFIHWGVYSGPGGEWNGKPFKGYAEHLMRIQKIPLAQYKERVVAPFNPVKFNADEWVSLIKGAGMKYLIITAKHHDGFAMWPSKVSPYNIHDATKFGGDPMRELADACRRNGIRFGFYYSHAFDWEDPDAPGNDWDYDNPGGDKKLHGDTEWYDLHPELLEKARRYVDRKAIPQVRELIAMYHPDILWFDTPQKLPVSEQLRILKAVRDADPNVVVNGRCARAPGYNFGDYANTGDRAAEFPPTPGDWEAIPTTNESYGYHRFDASHKPASYFIELLAKAAARGGNLLLNIGPMGDGEIDPKDQRILRGIGEWMAGNAASIRGTTRTPLPVQAWGESTLKGNTIFLHVLRPPSGPIVVGGLKTDVRKAYVLATGKPVQVRRLSPLDVSIDSGEGVIALELAGPIATGPVRLLSVHQRNVLRAFDAQLEGQGFHYTDGKAPHTYVYGWTQPAQSIVWPARLAEGGEFEISIRYSTGSPSDRGTFAVEVGNRRLTAKIGATAKDTEPRDVVLGTVKLPAGPAEVRIRAIDLPGESIRPFWVALQPK
jgi:alpha-L-fucosidase